MNIKRSIGLSFIYVGAVIGAGFSSGQEIWRFIARHGIAGIYIIPIIAIFFIVLAPLFFKLGKNLNIESYQDFFYKYLPIPFSYFFDFIFSCFLIGSVSVMLAGAGALFSDLLGMPYLIGVGITLVFVILTLILNREGIMTVNSVLVPILIVITIYTVLSYLINDSFLVENVTGISRIKNINRNIDWIKDGFFYSAYNLVIAVAVMTNIVYKEKETDIAIGGIIGGIILCILIIIIFIGLVTAFQNTPQEEIPLLYLAKSIGKGVYLSYIIALYFAMVTTSIANYYAFTKRLISLINIKYESGLFMGFLFVLPLIPYGFSNLVDNLYPFFGGLSLIIIVFYLLILLKEDPKKI